MKANLPSGYVKFINRLWMRRRHRFERDWVCTQPLASTDPAAPEQPTKLHEYQDILARLGASVPVAKAARKAWKTTAGRKAIKVITVATIDIPSQIASEPIDLIEIHRSRVGEVRTAIRALRTLIDQDRATVSARVYDDEAPEISDEDYEELPPEDEQPLAQPPLPSTFWYSGALGGIEAEVPIWRVFELDLPVSGSLTGRLDLYDLARLLSNVEVALAAREEELAGRTPDTQSDATVNERRVVFALDDSLAPFSEAFSRKEMGTLQRNALVAAFASVLVGSLAGDHAECLKRVGEMLRRRKKYRKSASRKE